MSRIGLVGPSYTSQSPNADCQMCMNWYVEKIESDAGKSGHALYSTPGLKKWYDLGTAGLRGMITAQARTFVVAGSKLWELYSPSATPNKVDRSGGLSMVTDGQPVSMASGPTQVLIASAGSAYVFDLKLNTLSDVSATLGPPVAQVGYLYGFFVALFKDTNKIQTSAALDATTWPGANAALVSVFTDNVVGIYFDHNDMFVAGPKKIQPYYFSGNFPFPFDVREGTMVESGLAARFSPAQADNSIFWLEADDRGNAIVRRANGYAPGRISTHALEYAMSTYSTIADAVGMSYKDQGHEFYQLSFPSASKTWVYDTATGMWHERGFWDKKSGTFSQHRAQYHTFNFGKHLVGDPTTGAVYEMSINYLDDFGNNIRRVRRAPHISVEQQWITHSELQIDLETGLGPALPGNALATLFSIADSTKATWQVSVTDAGDLSAAPSTDLGSLVYLNDATTGTSWQITMTTLGVLKPISATANADYPTSIAMVSQGGGKNYSLFVTDLGNGRAQLDTVLVDLVVRGPRLMMRYSDDGGHTWSSERTASCGLPGEYRRRVMFRRMGRSRDRVYEISVSDPAQWRIIDAYLKASPGYGPQERMVSEMRKRA